MLLVILEAPIVHKAPRQKSSKQPKGLVPAALRLLYTETVKGPKDHIHTYINIRTCMCIYIYIDTCKYFYTRIYIDMYGYNG